MKKNIYPKILCALSLPLIIYGIIQLNLNGIDVTGYIRPVLMAVFAIFFVALPYRAKRWISVPIWLNLAWITFEVITGVIIYIRYGSVSVFGFLIGNVPQYLILIMTGLNLIKNRSGKAMTIFTVTSIALYTVLVAISFASGFNSDAYSAFVLLCIFYLPNILAAAGVFWMKMMEAKQK